MWRPTTGLHNPFGVSFNSRIVIRSIRTFSTAEGCNSLGFAIRDETRATRTERPHRHEFFQMRVDLAGEVRHHIGARTRALAAGSVSFVQPYRLHRGGRRSDSHFYVINFHHRFLRPERAVDPLCIDDVSLAETPELAPFLFQDHLDFRLDGADLRAVGDACAQMLAQSRHQRLCAAEMARAQLMLVIGTVCQRYESELARLSTFRLGRGLRRQGLCGITRFVREHYAKPIALAEVARAASMSPASVTALLKRETGKTFVQFLTEERLHRAQELLATTGLRVADVGRAVGFEDDAYFARRFRQFLGISPGEFRRRAAARC